MSTVVVACLAVVFLGANLVHVLRPIALPGAPPPDDPSSRSITPPGWARRNYSTLLSLSRGTLNGSVATFGLIQVGYPVGASIAEGMTAGFLSGFFQLTVMNERFSSYLHRAGSEVTRVVKWAWFQALFYGLVKAAGTIAGGGPGDLGALAVAYAVTITFGSAQYPWEAAIAARRALRTEQGGRRDGIRYVADLQTMAVSVTCVGVSILNSVGVPGSRLFLAAVGAAGLTYYTLVRLRRELWRRDAGWSAIALLGGAAPRPLRLPSRWRPERIRSLIARIALPVLGALLVDPGAGHAAGKRRTRAAGADPIVEVELPAPERAPAPRAPLSTPANPVVFSDGETVPRGYLPIPSARTALRVAGFLKLDAIHDTGPYSGDASDLPNLSLRGGPGGEQRHGLTRLHARESRLSLGTFTDTAAGPVVAFLEVDFFGSAGANTYGLRMRHAYLSWNWLLAGHTYSNFLDTDARGTTIEFNGPTAAGNRKRAQIRLGHLLAPGLAVAVALENGAADYTSPDGTRVVAADSVLVLDSDVVQQLPDLTGHLRFQSGDSHLALRGMARQLRVLAAGGQDGVEAPPHVRYGYGLALSGRWSYDGPSNLFAQVTGGQGLGGYVDDLDGQAATFDASGQRFLPQIGYAGLAGIEHHLSEKWRTNLIASVSGIQLPALAPAGAEVAPISRRFLQLFANALYAPTPGLLMGVEYGYYLRETNTPLSGWSHRVQMAILYRFGG